MLTSWTQMSKVYYSLSQGKRLNQSMDGLGVSDLQTLQVERLGLNIMFLMIIHIAVRDKALMVAQIETPH